MTIVFDTETIKIINIFETLTQVSIKDCILMDDRIYVIIEEGEFKKLRGNGHVLRNLEKTLNKKILIFEYSKDLSLFLKNSVKGMRELKIRNEKEKKIVEIVVENSFKSLVIGKDGKNNKSFEANFEKKL